MSASQIPQPLLWQFPLPRPHVGVPLGNGLQGVLIWGTDKLCLTVARAGFWDRRNGCSIPNDTTFKQVRQCVESGDEEGVRKLFAMRKREPGTAPFPQQFGGGRLELTFPDGWRPVLAQLDFAEACVEVSLASNDGRPVAQQLHIRQDAHAEVCWLELPPELMGQITIRLLPAFDLVHQDAMRQLGIAPPESWRDSHTGGFCQKLPADDSLAVAWRLDGNRLILATALGIEADETVRRTLGKFDAVAAAESARNWWSNYWADVPRLNLPDSILQELFDYGLYRQAGLIRSHAPAATLQGPWMEDTRIPPWSNDYHFNINVQLVYGAALATGRHDDTRPLWEMLRGWLPWLRKMGKNFYGIEGAMLLPHAVDDHCQLMGTFWAGTIDQACLAWMGQMAFRHFEFTRDENVLRELALPLLESAFLGYLAMLEKTTAPDGTWQYSLPVSVSPEFGGSDLKKCWGRDASFQLAALHSTLRLLINAANIFNRPADPRWHEVAEHLPPYTTVSAKGGGYGWISQDLRRIALWTGKDLPESHRHHSHLASIHPFHTVDPFDPAHQKTVAFSLNHWNALGAGNWTGWCLPWASAICARCGLPDAALSWLQLLARHFTNEGRATLHNADCAGVFAWDDGSLAWPDHRKGDDYLHYETMQMDAAMGAMSAVLEMLIQTRGETIHIADRLPKGWRELSFDRVRTEGGFLFSATFRNRRVSEVVVQSLHGCALRLRHGIIGPWQLDGEVREGEVLELNATEAGRTYTLRAKNIQPA